MSSLTLQTNLFPETSVNTRLQWGVGAFALHALALLLIFNTPYSPPQTPNIMSVALLSASEASAAPSVAVAKPVPSKVQAVAKTLPPTSSKSAISEAPAPSSSATASSKGVGSNSGKDGADSPYVAPRSDAAYLKNQYPAYPPMSRRLGEEGKVMLRVHVLANGTTDRVDINKSSGSARLDSAAQEAVQRWRFAPAQRAGIPIDEWVLVPVSFNLKEKK